MFSRDHEIYITFILYIFINLLSSEYLDLEIAATFQLQVQDHVPFLLNIYSPKHKELVPQYIDLHG